MHATSTHLSLPMADITHLLHCFFATKPRGSLGTFLQKGLQIIDQFSSRGESNVPSLVQEVNLRSPIFHNHKCMLNTFNVVYLRVT